MSTILAIADQHGKQQPAIRRSLELAELTGCDVHIVAFVYERFVMTEKDSATVENLKQTVIDITRQNLLNELSDINITQPSVRLDIIWEKHIDDWVVNQTKKDDYQYVLKTGHRSETFIYTPLDWHLIRECPVPVMIVAEKAWRKQNSILCALDLGTSSSSKLQLNRRLLEEASKLANVLKADLQCCYAIEIPEILKDLDMIDAKHTEQKKSERAMQQFKKLASEFDIDGNSLHIKAAEACKAIPSIANKLKAGLVIIGSSGRTGINAKIIGNTAEKALHHIRTDVLTVKLK